MEARGHIKLWQKLSPTYPIKFFIQSREGEFITHSFFVQLTVVDKTQFCVVRNFFGTSGKRKLYDDITDFTILSFTYRPDCLFLSVACVIIELFLFRPRSLWLFGHLGNRNVRFWGSIETVKAVLEFLNYVYKIVTMTARIEDRYYGLMFVRFCDGIWNVSVNW